MGLAKCKIVGTRGVACAREMKVKDFRVLRAVAELHGKGERVTAQHVVDYLEKQRPSVAPSYDKKVVDDSIRLGVAQQLICTNTKLKPTRHGEDLVRMTLTSTDPELGAYRLWSCKIGAVPVAAVVAG